jgi:hypothetical protein
MATSNKTNTKILNRTRVKVIPKIKTRNRMDKGPTANNRVDPVIRVDLIIPGDRTIQAELMRLADLVILVELRTLVYRMTPVVQEVPAGLVEVMAGANVKS